MRFGRNPDAVAIIARSALEFQPEAGEMDGFYASLPTFTRFAQIVDASAYRPLPDDWEIGLADVMSSTEAVARGRYKAVNLAGAAVISAVSNMLGTLDYPYVFTGDGMVCAVAPDRTVALRRTLSATVGWVGDALGLTLRAATVSVAAIRTAGFDVQVARFHSSPDVAYAMFSGGGIAWAEAALKSGALALLPQIENERPDLAGLSCRFRPMPARQGVILSLIVSPPGEAEPAAFSRVIDDLLALVGEGGGNPVPDMGPAWGWPPDGLDLEARVARQPGQSLWLNRLSVGVRTLVAAAVVKLGRPVGGFVPQNYRGQIAANSDFRKFEDGLMMTLDCSPSLADAMEERLREAQENGAINFGAHRQDAALLTCLVPNPTLSGHVHFVDGAGGGYTIAARNLKNARSAKLGRNLTPADPRSASGTLR